MVPGGATVTPAAASRLGDEATVRRGGPKASRISSMPSTLRGAWDETPDRTHRPHIFTTSTQPACVALSAGTLDSQEER
jgi:hypothetical protein